MLENRLPSFFDEIEKIAEESDRSDRVSKAAKGFVAGALPTAAALRFLVPRAEAAKEGIKAVRGLQPSTHSWLQSIGGLAVGTAGAVKALRDHKKSKDRKSTMQVSTGVV